MYPSAANFNKPVVFDDDGTWGTSRNDNCSVPRGDNGSVEVWAQDVSFGINHTCGVGKGKVHYYHTGDGSKAEGVYPITCGVTDHDSVGQMDCKALNAIADGIPDLYCDGTPPTCKDAHTNYCEGTSQNHDLCVQPPVNCIPQ